MKDIIDIIDINKISLGKVIEQVIVVASDDINNVNSFSSFITLYY